MKYVESMFTHCSAIEIITFNSILIDYVKLQHRNKNSLRKIIHIYFTTLKSK